MAGLWLVPLFEDYEADMGRSGRMNTSVIERLSVVDVLNMDWTLTILQEMTGLDQSCQTWLNSCNNSIAARIRHESNRTD